MRRLRSVMTLAVLLAVAGCDLDFGPEIETTSPTQEHVDACRTRMYLHPAMKITPLGFKLDASGLEADMWFKFKTDTRAAQDMFDPNVVDTSKFTDDLALDDEMGRIKWWDVKGKKLFGGGVELPDARCMNIGIEKTDEGCTVYIKWFET